MIKGFRQIVVLTAVSRVLGFGLWGAGAASAGYAAAAYFLLLDDGERGFIARALRLRRAPAGPAGTEERG